MLRFARSLMHLLIMAFVRVLYRLDVRGAVQLPREGAALVVANHQSWIDAFVFGAIWRRRVRFVMSHEMTSFPGFGWLFRLAEVIPIASRRKEPAIYERAMAEIDAALGRGEVVGIFPEGRLTRDGELGELKGGVMKILAQQPEVPVIPVGISGLWGSWLSFRDHPPMRGLPRRFRARVRLEVGAPIAGHAVTLPLLRRALLTRMRSRAALRGLDGPIANAS